MRQLFDDCVRDGETMLVCETHFEWKSMLLNDNFSLKWSTIFICFYSFKMLEMDFTAFLSSPGGIRCYQTTVAHFYEFAFDGAKFCTYPLSKIILIAWHRVVPFSVYAQDLFNLVKTEANLSEYYYKIHNI